MMNIRKKISILLVSCSLLAIVLTILVVNFTINHIFEDYMIHVQNQRYHRIVTYLEEAYKRDGHWKEDSGIELMHEAYMSNYNLTLFNKNKHLVWGMNPMDIRNKLHLENMKVQDQGVYKTETFSLFYNNEVVGYVEVGQYAPLLMSEEDAIFQESINKSIVASGIVSILVIIGVSLYFSKEISSPIKEVVNMSIRLSKGEFKEKSYEQSNIKEIEDLRKSINILAEKLNNQNMLRSRLITDINHEIRTPLHVLQNNIEAMIDGVFPVTQERLTNLNDEIVRFGSLLDNLEKIKEFESKSLQMDFKPINLYHLLENMFQDFHMEALKKNISLKLIKEDNDDFFILGDAQKLKQVFINIVNNSIKFTNSDGEIYIEIYKEDKIYVNVKDNGIGIKEEDLPFIFERLYRGDKSRHEIEGSGIGLTIAKNILDIHSASIEVESIEGKGTLFKIIFNVLDLA